MNSTYVFLIKEQDKREVYKPRNAQDIQHGQGTEEDACQYQEDKLPSMLYGGDCSCFVGIEHSC